MSRMPPQSARLTIALLSFAVAASVSCFKDKSLNLTEVARAPGAAPPSSSVLPTGVNELLIASGLQMPTAMAVAPDGRIFITEQCNGVRLVKDGALVATAVVRITPDCYNERGVLGVALAPDFATNPRLFVYYTVPSPVHNRVSVFTLNGDVATGGEQVVFDLDPLTFGHHNGGALQFGADGTLYIAVGDNGTSSNSPSLTSLMGKLLRINADGSIPSDNPFYTTATGKYRAIWARGFRNPFTFAVQPGTGRLYINDVGENTTEEIDEGVAGSNYGWPNCEGACSTPNPNYRDPIYSYTHADGCAITGGTFYNPSTPQLPDYVGKYFFGEYCNGWVRVLDPATHTATTFATGLSFPISLQVGTDGAVYYLQRGAEQNTGQLWRVAGTASQSPTISQNPSSVTVSTGQSATFTAGASGTPPLNYQWQRDGTDIPGATSPSYTIASTAMSDSAVTFRCVVTSPYGTATTGDAVLTVLNNHPPTATITDPPEGTTYHAGQTFTYGGTATDAESGDLDGSTFMWEVVFHHDTHTHPFITPWSGAGSGTFVVPTNGEVSPNVYYAILLTVTDPQGAKTTVERDIIPETSTITITSNPAGAQLTLDGQPFTAPKSVVSVVGMQRTLGVVTPQSVGGVTYDFTKWSDDGIATHAIATPATSTTFTAAFDPTPCTYGISSTSRSVGAAAGGPFSVDVTSGGGCQWTATSNDGWLTITAGPTGTANGTVSYSVAANAGVQRTGTMTIAGQTFSVTQSNGCVYAIAPTGQSFGAGGGSGTVGLSTDLTCDWSAASNAGWITITAGAGGAGSGSTDFTVSANSGSARTGTMTIGGKTYTVNQAGVCAYTLTPTSQTFSSGSGSGTVAVATTSSCAWNAASNNTWITITSGSSGVGNGSTGFSVSSNSGGQRTGTITVAGQTFAVTQNAVIQNDGCSYTIDTNSQNFDWGGGMGVVYVTTGPTCGWAATPNDPWISIASGSSGTGNGAVWHSAAANTGAYRTGSITIAGHKFTVRQYACPFSLGTSSRNFGSSGGSSTIAVSTDPDCAWTATSNTNWITLTSGGNSSGNGSAGYSVSANSGGQRSGSIAIAGTTFSVTQDAAGSGSCSYTISPTSRTMSRSGGTGTVSVTTSGSCSWSAASNNSWITVTGGSNGSGSGTVSYSVSSRSRFSSTRTGTITIAGQTFTINQ